VPIILATQEARDQEDCSLKPFWGNSSQDSKKVLHKKGLVVYALSSNSSTEKKKRKEKVNKKLS
jgi:hypothetical protein